MPKGVPTGNPTNLVCWLQGGRYHDTVWGIAYDKNNLLDEIQMIHYDNPAARAQGVQILGISKTGPQDELKIEDYQLVYSQEEPPAFAVYVCEQDEDRFQSWRDSPDEELEALKSRKGYDLPAEHLDPVNMPGATRVVDIE